YYRILSSKTFKTSSIYRMIVFNGIANCMQFTAHMLWIQMGTLPNLHGYFAFLMDYHLVNMCIFINFFAFAVHTSSSFMIALNRLLSILKITRVANTFNQFSLVSSLLSALKLIARSMLVIVGYCYYDPVLSPTGQTHYVPVGKDMTLLAPWAIYSVTVGGVAKVLSGMLAFQLMNRE
ncbi:hypothetical protein PMAYCL1PPCAC_15024, partial [Pristionchus mayeri]